MNIKKTHSKNGKKYNVIIKAEENIVEGKQYPAIFKEVKMSNKAPVWFTNWTTEFEKKNDARWNCQEQFNKEMLDFKSNQEQFNKEVISRLDNIETRLTNIENCPTIKAELQQTN